VNDRGDLEHAVVDASAVVDFVLRPQETGVLAAMLASKDVDLHVPMLCDIEVAAGLRRALRRGELSTHRAQLALADLSDLPLNHYEHEPILGRVLELYENFSVYDAAYVALAEALGASLLTADRRLARATRAHTSVQVIEST